MKKIDANGLVVSSAACIVYIACAITVLRVFAARWGISGEPNTGHAEGVLKYYAAISLTIFGGVMLVLILYRLDDLMKRPAPEWVFAAFGIVVPFAIYFGIPSF